MSIFKSSTTVTTAPTLEERSGAAAATAASALSIFELAAGDLERAANELDEVRDEAAAEAARHLDIKLQANDAAYRHRVQAQKIRDLVGSAE
jgi:hypothetical protein